MAQEGLFEQPVWAMLARALADAAAGYPGDGQIYLVASYAEVALGTAMLNGPYDIQPAFETAQDARNWIECRNLQGYGVFGPFESILNQPLTSTQQTVEEITIVTNLDDTIPLSAVEASPPGEVEFPVGSPPGGAIFFDALFMSATAVAKFAVPYYARLYSPEFGQRVMREFQQADVALMGHYPWSEYTDIPDSAATLAFDGCRALAHVPVIFNRDAGGHWVRRVIHPHPHERTP